MQEIGIQSSIFKDLIQGRKTIEGRLGKPKYIKLRVRDEFSIREDIYEGNTIKRSIPGSAHVIITQLLYFESLAEMLRAVDFHKALPQAASVEEALAIYRQFYSDVDEEEYGVVAITFKVA